jgi:hypothetical protein
MNISTLRGTDLSMGELAHLRRTVFAGDPTMAKPQDPREEAEKAKKKPGGQQHQNPPSKTSTDNPERNPRDQKGRGGTK